MPQYVKEITVGEVLALANQKGGVGKTTTAVNLSACLAEAGKKTLVVDIDPQGNATIGLGVSRDDAARSIYEVLLGDGDITALVTDTGVERLDLVPSQPRLAGAEVELVEAERRELRLREAIGQVRGDYDYVVIDCPPSLGLLTVNSLAAADGVIVPVQCEYYALEGLRQLLAVLRRVRSGLNPALDIRGVVMTMADGRTNLSRQVIEEVRGFFGGKVFDAVIPRCVRLGEAPSFGMPIAKYDARSAGAEAYRHLAKEVIDDGKESTGQGA